MSIIAERLHHVEHISMKNSMGHNFVSELIKLTLGREFPMDEQECDFQEGGIFGQLLDWVPTIFQDTLVTVDVGNLGGRADGVHISWIIDSEWLFIVIRNLSKVLRIHKV